MIKTITIVRHGESEGNKNRKIYETCPDSDVELTTYGKLQAERLTNKMAVVLTNLTGKLINNKSSKVVFYYSPYKRAAETYAIFKKNLSKEYPLIAYSLLDQEEVLIREHEYPILKDLEVMDEEIKLMNSLGSAGYFYRFKDGESSADVELRLRVFLNNIENTDIEHLFLFCHGCTQKIFSKILLGLTIDEYNKISHLRNCEFLTFKNRKTGFEVDRGSSNAREHLESLDNLHCIKKVA